MNYIFVDIGSTTIKVYRSNGKDLEVVSQKSIPLKEGFDAHVGLSSDIKNKLFDYLESIQQSNSGLEMRLYGTAIFRKMSEEAKKSFANELHEKLGLTCEILSQDLENKYLELALVDRFSATEPILLINIGGGSTELVIVREKSDSERVNLDFGVGTINTQFPEINNSLSGVSLESLAKEIDAKIPNPSLSVRIAFYTGGELNYMKLAGYRLEQNTVFTDNDHPLVISKSNFAKRNSEIFSSVTLSELESLMPNNPQWMHGARACSAIAETICKKYGVEIIIPSDSNLIHGIARELFHKA